MKYQFQIWRGVDCHARFHIPHKVNSAPIQPADISLVNIWLLQKAYVRGVLGQISFQADMNESGMMTIQLVNFKVKGHVGNVFR